MKKEEINVLWDKKCQFLGRNGYFSNLGISIQNLTFEENEEWKDYALDCIRIFPLTAKEKNKAKCFIEIPKEKIEEFIEALKKFIE